MDRSTETAAPVDADPNPDRPGPARGRVAAFLVVLLGLVGWYVDHRAGALEREWQQRTRAEFERTCDDPESAAAMVENMPAFAAVCPAGLRHLLTIPAPEVAPGTELVDAYLDRLLRLVGAELAGDVTPYLGALHRDNRYAVALGELHRNARRCDALSSAGPTASASPPSYASFWQDWRRIEVEPQPSSMRLTTVSPRRAVIDVRVVDTIPFCLTRPVTDTATLPRFTGTTALHLSFSAGVGPSGQPVWLLDELRACPVRPDPLVAEPVVGTYSLTRRQSVREDVADSLFAYAGTTCPAPSAMVGDGPP